MWIDLGIDTGNILATKCLTLTGKEDLNELHLKVMNEAHQLYVDSIKSIEQGHKQSVPQKTIAEGTTFYTRQWGLKQKIRLVRNFKNWDRSVDKLFEKRKQENIIEISLPQ
jgi:methionyl-tRNA formyltransferase